MTDDLRLCFDGEPWQKGRELLERLLRTVQRRVKVEWRRNKAHALIFGMNSGMAQHSAEVAKGAVS